MASLVDMIMWGCHHTYDVTYHWPSYRMAPDILLGKTMQGCCYRTTLGLHNPSFYITLLFDKTIVA